MNIKDKNFKFNWDFEDLDNYSIDQFRKCNHCKNEYKISDWIDFFRSEIGIKYFDTYLLSSCLCYFCNNNYRNILFALFEIKINDDTTWFVPNRLWLEKISHTKNVDFAWFERLRLFETTPDNPKYFNHYHNDKGKTKSDNKPIQISFFDGLEY